MIRGMEFKLHEQRLKELGRLRRFMGDPTVLKYLTFLHPL